MQFTGRFFTKLGKKQRKTDSEPKPGSLVKQIVEISTTVILFH